MSKKKKIIAIVVALLFIASSIAAGLYYTMKTETVTYSRKDEAGVTFYANVIKNRDNVKEIKFATNMPYEAINAKSLDSKAIKKVIDSNKDKLVESSKQIYGRNSIVDSYITLNEKQKTIEASVTIDTEKLSNSSKKLFNTQPKDKLTFKAVDDSLTNAGFKKENKK